MASSTEAKITFKAETADFQAQIKEANSELSDLRAELKLNEAQFQNTGDESTYYQTKLDLLSQELEANREKQEALRSEIEVAKEVYGENSEEVGKLETSLTYAQIQEENLKKQVTDTTDAMNGQTDATDDAGMSINDFAAIIQAAGIADAVKEIVDAAYEMAEAFDESTAAIVEGTGASGDALEDLEQSAQDAFGAIADSDTTLTDVSETLAEINTRFGLTGDAAEDLTEDIVNFANHTDTDAVSAVDSIADVTQRWGLDVDDVSALLDDLTTANQSCQLSVDDLSGYLSKNSTQFQELGYSTEDALALLISLSDGGANVSTVMSGMTKAVSNLSEVTDDVPGAFQDAITAIGECGSVSEALQAQVGDTGLTVEDVFGTKAAQELATNVQTGNFAIEDWTTVLETNEGALESTTEGATTMGDSWSQAMNNAGLAIGTIFSPAVESVVTTVADLVTQFAQAVQESSALQAVIVVVAAALGILAAALAISSIISGVQKAMSLLNTTMLANPIVLVVTALAALAAGLVYAYQNCEEFRNTVDTAFAAVSEIVGTVVETVTQLFSDFVATAGEVWGTISGTVTGVMQTISGTVSSVWGTITSTVGSAVSTISSTISTVLSTAAGIVSSVLGTISSVFSSVFSVVSSVVTTAMTTVQTKIINPMQTAFSTVSTILGNISEKFSSIFETVKSTVSSAIETVKGYFDFSWSLPSIKLPHFSISGEFSLSPLSVPSFSVKWYKEGGILDGATIFGALGDNLLGGGEAGPEAVAPIDVLQDYVADAVNGAIADSMMAMASAIEALAERRIVLTIDGKEVATTTVKYMDQELGKLATRRARS